MLKMSQFWKDSVTKVSLHLAIYSSLDESEHTGKAQSLSQRKKKEKEKKHNRDNNHLFPLDLQAQKKKNEKNSLTIFL